MKRLLIVLCLAFLAATSSFAQKFNLPQGPKAPDEIWVLCIGNSFTFHHNADDLLREIAAKEGLKMQIGEYLKGGQTFGQHLKLEGTQKALKGGPYDYCFLQDQSVNPARYARDGKTQVLDDLLELRDRVAAASPDCKIILEHTWSYSGKEAGGFGTQEELEKYLLEGSRQMAKKARVGYSPIGEAFQTVYTDRPEIHLLGRDNKHQSLAGAYLKACVNYLMMARKPFSAHAADCGLAPEVAAYLRQTAEKTVLGKNGARPRKGDIKLADKVAEWQMGHLNPKDRPVGWLNAAFFRGLAEWAFVTGNETFWNYLKKVGDDNGWDMVRTNHNANDLCMGQTYLMLSEHFRDPAMMKSVRDRVLSVMAHPNQDPLILPDGRYNPDRWGWCDALFMEPPVYPTLARIDKRDDYLDFCWSEFKVTTDSLFNRKYNLYHRDLMLVSRKEENGLPAFWGRGNGWVYAALPMMLSGVPETHPSHAYYMQLYKDMSEALLKCQDKAGSWHAGLLDPVHWDAPENSGSGFFVYGFAWGVNHGILPEEYRAAALKGWKALKSHVLKDGRLVYVQDVGLKPVNPSKDDTRAYGAGAFLLAASEMIQMQMK